MLRNGGELDLLRNQRVRWPGEEEEKTEKSKWWGAVWPILCEEEKKVRWPGEDGEATGEDEVG